MVQDPATQSSTAAVKVGSAHRQVWFFGGHGDWGIDETKHSSWLLVLFNWDGGIPRMGAGRGLVGPGWQWLGWTGKLEAEKPPKTPSY